MKTEIHNLIVLDESGSMCGVRRATVTGCNETLNTIRAAQEKYKETQDHFVSIYLFQSNPTIPSRYIIKDVHISKVDSISESQYVPSGCTPLYDALGITITDLKESVNRSEMGIGNVTIITDGLENSSREYTHAQVKQMIASLKERGWAFNFIGANIDVEYVSRSLNITNHMEFSQDEEGMKEMFAFERKSRMAWAKRGHDLTKEMYDAMPCASNDEMKSRISNLYADAACDYFVDKDEDGDKQS